MSQDQPIARRRVVILNGLGLHLRPATKFATLAQRYRSEIRVRYNDQESNGKGILDLAMLAAGPGAGLDLEAVGEDAESALAALAALVDARFHETDDGEPLTEETTS